MARKFICSYLGRSKIEVSLEKVPQEDRATKGSTLYLYPRSTKTLTQAEIDEVKKSLANNKRFLVVQREIKGLTQAQKLAKMSDQEREAFKKESVALRKKRFEAKKKAKKEKEKAETKVEKPEKPEGKKGKPSVDKPPKPKTK